MEKNQGPKIPPQYYENCLTLAQLFKIPIQQAYHQLQCYGFHLQNAINSRFEPNIPPQNYQNNVIHKSINDFTYGKQLINLIDDDDGDRLVTRMRKKRQIDAQRKNYQKTYLIKKDAKIKKKKFITKKRDIINLQSQSADKIDEQFNFKKSLDRLVQGEVHVTFQQQVCQTFELFWKQRPKLIALHCIDFADSTKELVSPDKQLLEFTKIIYQTPLYVETFNKHFINYGLDISKFDFSFYSFFREFITENDSYSIVLLRYNTKSQKMQVLRKLPFSQTFKPTSPQQILSYIHIIKMEQNNKLKDQRCQEYMTVEEKKKLNQDRLIRQEQQELYMKQLSNQKNVQQPFVVPIVQEKNLSQIRANNRSLLTIYPQDIEDSISIKVRLPSAQVLYFRLPRTQTLDYIFKSIENSQKEQLGFEDQTNRKFDIISPFQKISLIERKLDKLSEIFGDSDMETLIVKEL